MTIEIRQRPLTWGITKLGFGLLMALAATAILQEPEPAALRDNLPRELFLIALAVGGTLLAVGNAWLLIRRPIVLRATAEGLWFGAGPTIPWPQVSSVYEAGAYFNRYGHSGRTHAVAFAFHRPTTMFKLPPFLWLTTLPFGNIRIVVETSDMHPQVLTAQLQSMLDAATATGERARDQPDDPS